MVAKANSHAFGYVPQVVREQRKKENCLLIRNQGRFYNNDKLVNHFRQIHEGEQKKRLNQIESAKGKMEKYKMAVSAILAPKVGYGFADELKRAWFWVRKVRFGCLMVVSDDSNFVEVFQEATLRCLKMVVVGDMSDGVLKKIANAFE
ncbi:hypothetical protein CUMW_263450, partial [Citrus unshiu]